nr:MULTISPECIES: hypothetical protein [Serratia]ULG12085.1 SefI [Serratia entomophila]ULG12396.1 SefI [Serratia entomophila]ULG19684.1 SefI [Serratia proteamaculans]
MQLRRYMLNISDIFLIIFLSFVAFNSSAAVFNIEYDNNNIVISKGDTYDSFDNSDYSYYCDSALNRVTVTAHTVQTANDAGKVVGTTSGITNGNCYRAAAKLLPISVELWGKLPVKMICIHGGTVLLGYQSNFCTFSNDLSSTVEDAVCTITSGDITHNYGTILTDEVEGKSVTTNATLSCTGGSISGEVSVALSLGDENVNLKNDNSLYAQLNLDGNGKSTTATIDINGSTNISLTSTLHTNGNVSSGAFSGSSVLTMTYY